MTATYKKHLYFWAQLIGLVILSWSFAMAFIAASEQTEPEANEKPGFTGRWQRNEDESDDPEEKFREAFEAMRRQMDGRRPGGMGGGIMPPPGGGGGAPPGGREGRGGRPGGPGGTAGGPGALADLGDEIETVLKDNEFHVIPSDEGRVRIFYLDGEKHMREAPNGAKIETTSERRGNRITTEQKMERGPTIHTTYELVPDGSRMVVTVKFEGGRMMKEPVVIRTVYDALSGEAIP